MEEKKQKTIDLTAEELLYLLQQADPHTYEVYKCISIIRTHGFGKLEVQITNGKIVNIAMTQTIKV